MKDLKISKELLSEVLGIHTILMNPIIEPGNNIGYLVYGRQNTLEEVRRNHKQINIYEFAFMCKEWAYKNFKIMLISQYTGQCYINGDLSPLILNWWNDTKSYQVEDSTEIEAIIKACEWILSEINK